MNPRTTALLALAACGGAPIGDDAGGDASSAGSRCTGDAVLTCTSHALQLSGRTVTYEVPLGTAPASGWPVVVFYQGSFIAGSRAFSAAMTDSLGQYQLTATVKALLDGGYAVIAPNAAGDGSQYWQTNVPPYSTSWAGCADDLLVLALLDAIRQGMFGTLDDGRLYAMGISSGGFMTSRMAVSYAGTFRALAIASASYATCGASCSVPPLPADHPPTLFLHGGQDMIVPPSTMTPYRDALGAKATAVISASAGHEWLADAVTAVPAWFASH